MTSTEIGANRAVERAFQQQQLKDAQDYRNQIRDELKKNGDDSSGYAVNRVLQKRREDEARQRAQQPFNAARSAQNQLDSVLGYMEKVQKVIDELTKYAHAT
jgi:hypothetical protein